MPKGIFEEGVHKSRAKQRLDEAGSVRGRRAAINRYVTAIRSVSS